MGQVTLRNTKGTPLTYTEVDNNFKFCDSDTNLIINGGLNIWQRGTSFASAADGTYSADRFVYFKVGTGVHSLLRSTDVPTQAQAGVKANYSLHADVTTADTSIASTDVYNLNYRVEGYDYAQIEGNTYTLSFWVKGTKTGVHCVSFRNASADRSYVVEYTINSTNTWEKKTVTVTFDYSGGTWNYTTGVGLTISWVLAAGSNFHTTADAWQSSNSVATSNQVNAVDSTSNDFRLALVKLEPGVEATQFRFRHFNRELSYCQRYYFKTFDQDTAPAQNAGFGSSLIYSAAVGGSVRQGEYCRFPVSMRSSPSVTFYNTSALNTNWRNVSAATDSGAASTSAAGENGVGILNPQVAGDVAGQVMAIHLAASAEL